MPPFDRALDVTEYISCGAVRLLRMSRVPIFAGTCCLLIGISGVSAEKRYSETTERVPVIAPGFEPDFGLSKVPLTSLKWRRKSGFLLANFKIRNLNAFRVANIVVRC